MFRRAPGFRVGSALRAAVLRRHQCVAFVRPFGPRMLRGRLRRPLRGALRAPCGSRSALWSGGCAFVRPFGPRMLRGRLRRPLRGALRAPCGSRPAVVSSGVGARWCGPSGRECFAGGFAVRWARAACASRALRFALHPPGRLCWVGDADLRVRVHEVREPFRGARVARRRRSRLPGLRLGQRSEAALVVRGSRHRRTAQLRRTFRRGRLLRRGLWLRPLTHRAVNRSLRLSLRWRLAAIAAASRKGGHRSCSDRVIPTRS